MKKSTAVTIGLVLAAGVSFACASEPDQEFMDTEADHQQVCVEVQDNGDLVRDDDSDCPADREDNSHSGGHYYSGYHYWYYLGRAHGAPPAVGSKVNSSHGSFTRPSTGSIARPPASGGFGTFRALVAG